MPDSLVSQSKYINEQFQRVQEIIASFPRLARESAKPAFQKHGNYFIQTMARAQLRGRPGLNRRTGTLARAFNRAVFDEGGRVTLRVWVDSSAAAYAFMQEKGGTITPKKGKYLAIPIGAAVTRAGVSRHSSPREVDGLRFMQKKGGQPFLGKVEGGKVVAYFLLRKKVTIPARLGMEKTFRELAPMVYPAISREFNRRIGAEGTR
jgi:hypothetical protein